MFLWFDIFFMGMQDFITMARLHIRKEMACDAFDVGPSERYELCFVATPKKVLHCKTPTEILIVLSVQRSKG